MAPNRLLSRRRFLTLATAAGGGYLIAACNVNPTPQAAPIPATPEASKTPEPTPSPTPTSTPTPSPTATPIPEPYLIEKGIFKYWNHDQSLYLEVPLPKDLIFNSPLDHMDKNSTGQWILFNPTGQAVLIFRPDRVRTISDTPDFTQAILPTNPVKIEAGKAKWWDGQAGKYAAVPDPPKVPPEFVPKVDEARQILVLEEPETPDLLHFRVAQFDPESGKWIDFPNWGEYAVHDAENKLWNVYTRSGRLLATRREGQKEWEETAKPVELINSLDLYQEVGLDLKKTDQFIKTSLAELAKLPKRKLKASDKLISWRDGTQTALPRNSQGLLRDGLIKEVKSTSTKGVQNRDYLSGTLLGVYTHIRQYQHNNIDYVDTFRLLFLLMDSADKRGIVWLGLPYQQTPVYDLKFYSGEMLPDGFVNMTKTKSYKTVIDVMALEKHRGMPLVAGVPDRVDSNDFTEEMSSMKTDFHQLKGKRQAMTLADPWLPQELFP